jgi:hypothetical protein
MGLNFDGTITDKFFISKFGNDLIFPWGIFKTKENPDLICIKIEWLRLRPVLPDLTQIYPQKISTSLQAS